jgi:hypothetical protein
MKKKKERRVYLPRVLDRAVRLSNQVGWAGLAEAAALIEKVINRPAIEIADNIATIWSLSVSLGAYIEQDEDAPG